MSLKQVFEPYFTIGAAVSKAAFDHPDALRTLSAEYGSFTCENEMKPELLLDRDKTLANASGLPALKFDTVGRQLNFARENKMTMRGHTLVWHNQTPRWFFSENYSDEENAPLANRDTMLFRLEQYISSLLTFVQTEYPGIITVWDVVNEAVEDGGALRASYWTQTVGEDFIEQAFTFARRYADPGTALIYNDYSTYLPQKCKAIQELILQLHRKGLLDGVGMQSHLTMAEPDLADYDRALRAYGALGIQVQITELDIHNADSSEESMQRLAERYRKLFLMLLKAKKDGAANITNVTFWGMRDEDSWLSGFRKERSYPLLFHRHYQPKAAYFAVSGVPGLAEGDEEDRLPDGTCFDFWEQTPCFTQELHVNQNHPHASDENDGTDELPLTSIQAAADRAVPGTRIWIHGGVYRECVRPRLGGNSAKEMISYEAFGDGEAVIKASVAATQFMKSQGWMLQRPWEQEKLPDSIQIWETKLNPMDFQGYNPFCAVNILHDRLFIEYEKTDMTTYLNRRGMVFCDGKPLLQVQLYHRLAKIPGSYWVEANGQTIHFRLADDGNPEDHLIELTCREQCFAPEVPFLSYIRVRGITCAHAATGAPVPQRGAISCYRGHHWIIENCKIDWSNCVGIDIGNECWHHPFIEGQIIGRTIVRGCEIYHAGVCGIAGLFATGLLIEDNLIQGTGWQKMELSWEAGGIKVHNSIGSMIRRNIFTETLRADHLWMDVGNENNRITRNLFLNGREQREAVFMECSRDGINLIDHNIFWNVEGRFNEKDIPNEPGSTGWYKQEEHNTINGYAVYGEGTDRLHIVHNLIGCCRSAGYFAKPVAFRIDRGGRGGTSREAWLHNNLFYDCGEAAIKFPTRENQAKGNLYVKMPGGYLRVLYPAPEACLDLEAWQEFYGFDLEGQEGWFDIQLDTEKFTLQLGASDCMPPVNPRGTGHRHYALNADDTAPVAPSVEAGVDFYGISHLHRCVPGPFASLQAGHCYRIDPRKK